MGNVTPGSRSTRTLEHLASGHTEIVPLKLGALDSRLHPPATDTTDRKNFGAPWIGVQSITPEAFEASWRVNAHDALAVNREVLLLRL
jgi:hypothetical protein